MKYTLKHLPNGLRILLAPVRSSLTSTVLILVGTGSRYETKELNGISHFLEHMFFKGTPKRPTTLAIAEELDAIGGAYNAFTGKDKTGYWAKVGAEHTMKALDVVSDIFLHAKLDAKEIERERGAIIQEINMYEDTPMRLIGEKFEALLYGDHPLGWEIAGPKENILRFQRRDFLEYLHSHYVPANTVVCVAGNFSSREVLEKIRHDFGSLAPGEEPVLRRIREHQDSPALQAIRKETDQTHLMVGVRAFDMFHKDRYALSLLATILGGNMSSRLFIEVRERRGLAYTVHTFVELFHDAGYLATQCNVGHDRVEEALKVILREYRKIARQRVSPKELRKAKEYLKGKMEMGLETSDEQATFLADQELHRREIILPETIAKRLERVSTSDVLRVAKELFRPERLNAVLIGPQRESEVRRLKKVLTL